MEAAHIEKTGPAERIIYGSLPKPADAEALVPVRPRRSLIFQRTLPPS